MNRRIASDRDKLRFIFDTVDNLLSCEYDFVTLEAGLRQIREATGVCRECRGSAIVVEAGPAGHDGWVTPCRDCRDGVKNVWVDQNGEFIWGVKP